MLRKLPDNSTLRFDAGGCYRVESTLSVANRSNVVIDGQGATFRALLPRSDQQAFWRIIGSRAVVVRNMTIQGSYASGGVHNPSFQHAHAIDLRGSSAQVERVTMLDIAGDCVYFGRGYGVRHAPSSGHVRNVTCVRTSRNAVSVTSGEDILVERLRTNAIGLTAFDIEPNEGKGWGARRVAIRKNTIGTYALYALALVGGPIADVSFTDNLIHGKQPRIMIVGEPAPTGVLIRGNRP